MFHWFRPRHTVRSVARALTDGLSAGTVILRSPVEGADGSIRGSLSNGAAQTSNPADRPAAINPPPDATSSGPIR
jgi:hypothetical protein